MFFNLHISLSIRPQVRLSKDCKWIKKSYYQKLLIGMFYVWQKYMYVQGHPLPSGRWEWGNLVALGQPQIFPNKKVKTKDLSKNTL